MSAEARAIYRARAAVLIPVPGAHERTAGNSGQPNSAGEKVPRRPRACPLDSGVKLEFGPGREEAAPPRAAEEVERSELALPVAVMSDGWLV
ncbi:hypothetical protein NDU88_008197 [Pleurodeles waltl]|uniref:Uncharacterized protein n=1 Tax=Pleurodeles waltl TaxID=8319 RepID=A0AAV7NX26_PLEWA|nr:hypothetical protein NDU88_008197 [Pleurodeles waltl]